MKIRATIVEARNFMTAKQDSGLFGGWRLLVEAGPARVDFARVESQSSPGQRGPT